jgi:hypothetical protein
MLRLRSKRAQTALHLGRGFPERTREQVGYTQGGRVDTQVAAIQALRLDSDDAEDVPPLTFGCLTALAIPTQLLQEDVFRRVYVEDAPWPDLDRPTPAQLLIVERRTAGNEQIDLQLRDLMDEIGAGTFPNRAAERLFIDIEVCRERGDQCGHVGLGEGGHNIDVHGGSGLAGNRAGDRAADGVKNPELIECTRHGKRHRNRIDRNGHARSVVIISG